MDGWGKGQVPDADAIYHANTPFIDNLYSQYPHSELITSGEAVGLPDGQMGNSEVGHLNLGAGRVVYQDLVRINKSITDNTLKDYKELQETFNQAKLRNNTLHLMGLVSDGGVHSHLNHLIKLVEYATESGITNIFIHAFTDGRDTDPKSGINFIEILEKSIAHTPAKIVTVIGRYYAMDRDKRWDRVKLAYDALIHGIGTHSNSAIEAISNSYDAEITDEFILPHIIGNEASVNSRINQGDTVICFNYRTDRCREITEVLTQFSVEAENLHPINDLYYVTMTEYDEAYKNVHVIFKKDNLSNTLGEILSINNKSQIRIAETEKYPHVTFFFSGGRENEFEGEKRIICPSPKDVATYDLKPEMSAYDITNAIVPEIQKSEVDFICLNFANADMVGHTGVWEAAITAAETVNNCVEVIVNEALKNNYAVFLTADHGNSDYLINDDGSPNTAHTLNPVPLFFIENSDQKHHLKNGKLADIAPTILSYLNVPIPKEMTGEILLTTI